MSINLRASWGPNARLSFMQSHGGLVVADAFRGKDAVLSGPAGGIVGMSHVAAETGFDTRDRLRHGRHVDRRLALRRRLERILD